MDVSGPTRSTLSRVTSGLGRVLLTLLVILLLVAVVPPIRTRALQAVGELLIISDPIESVDIVAMTPGIEGGELELSDLYRDRVMSRMLVLVPEATSVDRELMRRGVYHEDLTLTTLVQLGVPRSAITTLEVGEGGTTESTEALAAWVTNHPSRVLVVVSATHTRRFRHAIRRVWPKNVPLPRVRSPRADPFHAADWWVARRTLREGLIEVQKFAWEYLRYPW